MSVASSATPGYLSRSRLLQPSRDLLAGFPLCVAVVPLGGFMTVAELIEELGKENPEMRVYIPGFEEYGYVDISRVERDQDHVLVTPKR